MIVPVPLSWSARPLARNTVLSDGWHQIT